MTLSIVASISRRYCLQYIATKTRVRDWSPGLAEGLHLDAALDLTTWRPGMCGEKITRCTGPLVLTGDSP